MRQDEGILEGKVLEVWEEEGMVWAKVSVRGVIVKALSRLVDDIRVGDRVLLHGRVILARLEQEKGEGQGS